MRRAAAGLVLLALAGCSSTRTAAPTPSATATPTPTPTPSASPSPTPTRSPSPTPSASARPGFTWGVARVTAADLPHSWHPGCPVGPAQLRRLSLAYVGFDGARHTGVLVVNAQAVRPLVTAFGRLYALRFPFRSLRPVDDFGGSDDASMAADNTSAFNCRTAVGGTGWSMHAYGLAVDLDPRENPYLQGGLVRPPQGSAYLDRSRVRPGMVVAGSAVVRAFAAVGWEWGGRWRGTPDYQHFSSNGR